MALNLRRKLAASKNGEYCAIFALQYLPGFSDGPRVLGTCAMWNMRSKCQIAVFKPWRWSHASWHGKMRRLVVSGVEVGSRVLGGKSSQGRVMTTSLAAGCPRLLDVPHALEAQESASSVAVSEWC